VEVLDRHTTENDGYVTKLELRHPRVIRTKGGRTIKHVVDHNLEEKLSQPFFFVQGPNGEVTHVFYPHDDSADVVGMKKGKLIALMMICLEKALSETFAELKWVDSSISSKLFSPEI
jgi:hypothetical protein